MDFLKKNYEKFLLGVVLLALAVLALSLQFKIEHEKQALSDKRESLIMFHPSALKPIDETRFNAVYERLERPGGLDFSKSHNLFNPVQWQKAADGHLIKVQNGSEIGPQAVLVTKMNPLFTTITFESIGESGSNYVVSVTRDADPNPKNRRKKSAIYEVGTKGDFVTLQEVKGAPDKPELNFIMEDTGEKIAVTMDSPHQRVDGYSVDLKYDPEKLVWPARRVGARLTFAGDDYAVAAINLIATNQYEVVLSSKSTGKKTTIRSGAETQP